MAEDAVVNNDALKAQLDLQKLRLELTQDRVDIYKSLVPDLSTYKRDAPQAPMVEATTTRVAFTQASEMAGIIENQVRRHATGGVVLLESTQLLGYISAVDSVQALLNASIDAVEKNTGYVQDAIKSIRPSIKEKPTGSNTGQWMQPRIAPALLALPALVESGFAIASAMRTSYSMSGSRHEDLSTKVLQAQVVAALAESKDTADPAVKKQSIQVIDVDTYLPVGTAGGVTPGAKIHAQIAKLTRSLDLASITMKEANAISKGLREVAKPSEKGGDDKDKIEQADLLEAQAKVLSGVLVQAEKYLLSVHTPMESGLTPLIAATRGEWLRDVLSTSPPPPRLSLSSVVSATDIVAADGWIKGLRISVAGNTVVQWRLVFADGRVVAGAAQACETSSAPSCVRALLKPDDGVK
ncbi:hypothetical protein [Acidovorax sp. NCPPB 3576]|uniref:hypothetical protein n=1 Tax=Acidovorax sp. NCPPB 3576 TaxID=2940488 RepID=UPI0023497FE8|nr:hypothetical protein [Acidovorax sp. NCPPB 3576]WCM90565.1 hypothetical protein M5C98_11335 [Acidovorax sp. NCPPB 3576]